MKITLLRTIHGIASTQGMLYINGHFFAYTLEDKVRDSGVKIYGATAIPSGFFQVKATKSNRFNRILPELLNVPNFSGIRVHGGNDSSDTLGCILIGAKRTSRGIAVCSEVVNSLSNRILEAQNRDEAVTIGIFNSLDNLYLEPEYWVDMMDYKACYP